MAIKFFFEISVAYLLLFAFLFVFLFLCCYHSVRISPISSFFFFNLLVCDVSCVGKSDSQHGSTALLYAVASGHVDCVRLLMDAGADKEAKTSVRVGYCSAEAYFLFSCFATLQVFSFRVFHRFSFRQLHIHYPRVSGLVCLHVQFLPLSFSFSQSCLPSMFLVEPAHPALFSALLSLFLSLSRIAPNYILLFSVSISLSRFHLHVISSFCRIFFISMVH